MTRAELYQEFKNRPYSVAITKAMWFIQENSTIECTEEDLQKNVRQVHGYTVY